MLSKIFSSTPERVKYTVKFDESVRLSSAESSTALPLPKIPQAVEVPRKVNAKNKSCHTILDENDLDIDANSHKQEQCLTLNSTKLIPERRVLDALVLQVFKDKENSQDNLDFEKALANEQQRQKDKLKNRFNKRKDKKKNVLNKIRFMKKGQRKMAKLTPELEQKLMDELKALDLEGEEELRLGSELEEHNLAEVLTDFEKAIGNSGNELKQTNLHQNDHFANGVLSRSYNARANLLQEKSGLKNVCQTPHMIEPLILSRNVLSALKAELRQMLRKQAALEKRVNIAVRDVANEEYVYYKHDNQNVHEQSIILQSFQPKAKNTTRTFTANTRRATLSSLSSLSTSPHEDTPPPHEDTPPNPPNPDTPVPHNSIVSPSFTRDVLHFNPVPLSPVGTPNLSKELMRRDSNEYERFEYCCLGMSYYVLSVVSKLRGKRFHSSKVMPTYHYITHLFKTLHVECECIVYAYTYLHRLLAKTACDTKMKSDGWKYLVIGSSLLASKFQDDLSVVNSDFAAVIKGLSIRRLNKLEVMFLKGIGWQTYLTKCEYSNNYCHLQELGQQISKILPFEKSSSRSRIVDACFHDGQIV